MFRIRMILIMVFVLLLGAVLPLQAQDSPAEIGVAPNGQTAFEFIGQIDQSVFDLTSYGYVTYINGLSGDLLFSEGTAAMFRDESTARFTFMASGVASARSHYENIFAATSSATFNIYYNETPGAANFDEPDSFATGTLVATFEGRLYSMLNVQEPNVGVLLVHSDTIQTSANPFALDSQSYQMGYVNQIARFTLFGQGFRTSTEPLGAYYHVGADMVSFGALEEE